jgi:integrase
MPTFSQLPSKKWRVQVRKAGVYRAATFDLKRDAADWAKAIETQLTHVQAKGFAPVPKTATLSDLIEKYLESFAKTSGRTKAATLEMFKRDMGNVKLVNLSSIVLRDFMDKRQAAGAGGVTIAADLSFLTTVLKWGRHVRRLDLPENLAKDARTDLAMRGLNTRSQERDREPTDGELAQLYALWDGNKRQKVPMTMLCKFALGTGMRQSEITSLTVEDLDIAGKSVLIRNRKDPQNKQGNNQRVPLLADAWAIVEPLIHERKTGFLFPYNARSISAAFTRGCQDVTPPIVDLHFHDLRHRATASFFRMGLTIPQVSLLTGHKTWSMLARYTKITADDVHDALK